MQDCTNCEVTNGLRRDVDNLKEYTDSINNSVVELKQINTGAAVEVEHLNVFVTKVENTMNTLVEKLEGISVKIASLNFYTREEVDNKFKNDTMEMMKDIKELKEKPAKKWDDVEKTIITSIVSILVGFIASQILGK